MKNEHIINLIEDNSIARLNEGDLETIKVHARECEDCLHAYQAAQISHSLMKERVAAEFVPPPFFHTRVLATLRERQTANESWSFARLWKATGVLASSMVATFATLAVLTFVIPDTQQQVGSLSNVNPAEEVILNQTSQPEEESDGQLLTTIYGGEEEASR